MRAATGARATLAAIAVAAVSALASAQPFPLSLSGKVQGSFELWEDRGSALAGAGSADAYAGASSLDFRAEAPVGSESLSRCAFEGLVEVDAASGEASFAARELWAEWRPVSAIALRVGRQRLGFGSGFGWNPSNDLDPPRDASDPTAPRVGADAAQVRFEAGDAAGFPLSLSIVGLMPKEGEGLASARYGAQLYALVGGLELMAVASASDLGGSSESWLAGAWATAPAGPVVLGLEAAARERSDLYRPGAGGLPEADRGVHAAAVATATLRAGDFVIVAEGHWDGAAYGREELAAMLAPAALPYWAGKLGCLLASGSVGGWHALGRATWASGDWAASCGALVDLETGAFVASAEAQVALQGVAALRLAATLPGAAGLVDDDELGLSGRGWSAGASVALSF